MSFSAERRVGDEPSYHRGLIAGSRVPVEAVTLSDEEIPGTVVTGRVERVLWGKRKSVLWCCNS